jgi:enoyl-CoA hydratase/carnithine racemase
LSKPIVAALNGVAAGSGFQFSLLQDIRVGHLNTRMGQPEINAGIASITGPWIMREILGLGRTTELVLTGRMVGGAEALQMGLMHELVDIDQVLTRSMEIATDLASKAPLAMRLNKNWLREMTQADFNAAFKHALEAHAESYRSGEPQRASKQFLKD